MRIKKPYFVKYGLRPKSWIICLFPSLNIGRYFGGFCIFLKWLIFEIQIDIDENK